MFFIGHIFSGSIEPNLTCIFYKEKNTQITWKYKKNQTHTRPKQPNLFWAYDYNARLSLKHGYEPANFDTSTHKDHTEI